MNTPAAIVRYAMLEYPSLYPCPLAVYHHLFTSGGHGYEWDSQGGITNRFPARQNDGMRYCDLDERKAELEKNNGIECLRALNLGRKLQLESEYISRKFIEDNIDDIVNSDPMLQLFEYRQTPYGFIKHVSIDYAMAFIFPDNITIEWAQVLTKFFDNWQVALNQEYGCTGKGDYWKAWPQGIIAVRNAIVAANERLKPVLYGPDWKNILQERDSVIQKIIEEIKTERQET